HAASAAPPAPTRSRPRRRTQWEAGNAPRIAPARAMSAGGTSPVPLPDGMGPVGGLSTGAAANGLPRLASMVTPWLVPSSPVLATRWPGSGWVMVHFAVDPRAPRKHWTSVNSHGAATSTVLFEMVTGQ